MADRSDDIKQLFAHLGLNPTDYQEIKPAVSVSLSAIPAAAAPAPAPTPAAPAVAKPPEPKAASFPQLPPAMAEATVPGLRELMAQAAVPSATRQLPVPPRVMEKSSGPARRWALLDAVVAHPPGVLSRVVPLRQTPPPSGVPLLTPGDFRSTASSISTQRPDYLQMADPGSVRTARPSFTELQKAPASPRERAGADEATRIMPLPAKTAAVAPAAAAVAQKQTAAASASVALSDAFRRLVHPVVPASPVNGRLRFNYTARAGAAFNQKPAANELLGDVFNRIAGQTAHRAHQ